MFLCCCCWARGTPILRLYRLHGISVLSCKIVALNSFIGINAKKSDAVSWRTHIDIPLVLFAFQEVLFRIKHTIPGSSVVKIPNLGFNFSLSTCHIGYHQHSF